jgi:uncharacterized membrane protein YqjE
MSAEYSATGTPRESGVLGSIKRLVSTLVDVAHTRLQLFTNELKDEGLRLVRLALFAALAAFFFMLGIIFLSALVVVFYWESHRILAVSIVAGIYLALAAGFGWMLYQGARERSRLFEDSLRELAKDRERLLS